MIFSRFLKPSLSVVVLSFFAAAAHAQLAVYVSPTYSAYGYGNSADVTLKSGSGGFNAGAFYNFPIESRLTAGIDLRTTYSFGTKGGSFTGAALRVGFEPHRNSLRPYFQLGGGVVSTTGYTTTTTFSPYTGYVIATNSQRYTSGALELAFGLDIKLTNHFDIRAFEYGAAAGGSAAVGFLDAGVVYRFHPRTP